MKYLLILSINLILHLPALGATSSGLVDGTFPGGSEQFVIRETIAFSKPTFYSDHVDTLSPCAVVEVISETGSTGTTEGGYSFYWYLAEWHDGNSYISGYLPGSAFSLASLSGIDSNSVNRSLGIEVEGIDSLSREYTLKAIMFSEAEPVMSYGFSSGLIAGGSGFFPSYSVELIEKNPDGLTGVNEAFILSISFHDEGYDSIDRVLLVTDQDLQVLPAVRSTTPREETSDISRIVFPSDDEGGAGVLLVRRTVSSRRGDHPERQMEEEWIIWAPETD